VNLPIRTRLTIVYCAVFSLSTTLLETGAYVGLHSAVDAVVDRDLRNRLAGVESELNKHLSRMGLSRLQEELKAHGTLQPAFLKIKEVQGPVVFQGASMLNVAGPGAGVVPTVSAMQTDAGPRRVLAARRRIKQADYDIYVAADLTVPLGILGWFVLILLLSSPVMRACASIVGYWIAGRALAPVTEIAMAARSIGGADLSRRVAVPENRDELQYLAVTMNAMLSRIEDAFRHISQFTANAAHELRTPVAVIRATAEVALLRRPGDIETYREALVRILTEAKKNAELLNDMLSLTKADAGTNVLRLNPIDLGDNMRQACEGVELLAREKGVRFEASIGEDPVYVSADGDHLRRLWLILLDNAVTYTPRGHRIQVRMYSDKAGHVICEVEDKGIGISAADLPHIFERFYRADKARARMEGGAGLGLSIAKWIAGAHGARIEVESAVGTGSTFRIILPQLLESPSDVRVTSVA
jgi:heavy metal sensor kinase